MALFYYCICPIFRTLTGGVILIVLKNNNCNLFILKILSESGFFTNSSRLGAELKKSFSSILAIDLNKFIINLSSIVV